MKNIKFLLLFACIAQIAGTMHGYLSKENMIMVGGKNIILYSDYHKQIKNFEEDNNPPYVDLTHFLSELVVHNENKQIIPYNIERQIIVYEPHNELLLQTFRKAFEASQQ